MGADGLAQRAQFLVFGGEFRRLRQRLVEGELVDGVEFAVERHLRARECVVVAHNAFPSVFASAWRARARRDMTVPIGAWVASAISR